MRKRKKAARTNDDPQRKKEKTDEEWMETWFPERKMPERGFEHPDDMLRKVEQLESIMPTLGKFNKVLRSGNSNDTPSSKGPTSGWY